MSNISYLKDKDFLKSLDSYTNRSFWVRIEVLDSDEIPISSIEGRAQPGSVINIAGNSSVRRTCNISVVAEESENDLTNIDNLLSANKKIKIFEGIKNEVSGNYEDIIWFPLGVFVIIQPSITHSTGGCIINLSCKDKMCLLNGECAGGLPTSIIFDYYDQIIGLQEVQGSPPTLIDSPNDYTIYRNILTGECWKWSVFSSWEEGNIDSVGERVEVRQRIYDIIQTLVCNYGHESLSKIYINDVPLQIKQIVRYTGSGTLFYNTENEMYTFDEKYLTSEGTWREFSYNEDVGYVYTDFVYPAKKGGLTSSIGENVCSVLDKIKNTLGNYEYFYDVEGNFIFQEIKNYLNNSYEPIEGYRLDDYGKIDSEGRRITVLKENGLSIVDGANYEVDFHSNTKSIYTFNEGNGLIISFTNNPNYTNIKNDFHIWGENDDNYAIHYHLAIKQKPKVMNTYEVVFIKDDQGEYTGGLRLATSADADSDIQSYTPEDWRAELYLQGLTKQKNEIRPDIYEQELLDLFDSIYNFQEKKFKVDLVYHPNDLQYFFDYLEPTNNLYDCSVNVLGTKTYSYKQNKMNRLYNTDIPNVIMIDLDMDEEAREKLIDDCVRIGQPYSNVEDVIYKKVAEGTIGYTAQEVARDLLYQYTNYNESINIVSVPIYYLDVNTRITVQDRKSNIYGDYIINTISLPLDAGNSMNISASRALERI